MVMDAETIAAIATAPGRGGVAIVRLSGVDAFQVASKVIGKKIDASLAGRFLVSAFREPIQGKVIDSGVVLVYASPHSYTGENVVELQGHGGSVTPRRVLEACLAAGARLARRGEFTQRAFLNGRLDLSEAEAVIDLVDAKTDRAADEALCRLGGKASQQLEKLYTDCVALSANLEHALDFDENELPLSSVSKLETQAQDLQKAVTAWLATAREGKLLRQGALVVLVGAPNVGKSSLLNALVGESRAIVSDQAGTTRDTIEVWLEMSGWPVRLVDTAGLRVTGDAIEAEGVARARALVADADVVVRLESEAVGQVVRDDELLVHSKCDLQRGKGLNVSVRTGEGLAELKASLVERFCALALTNREETGADITTRQKGCLEVVQSALIRVTDALAMSDWVIAANEVRNATQSLGEMLGKVYYDDLLTAVFSKFCVGK